MKKFCYSQYIELLQINKKKKTQYSSFKGKDMNWQVSSEEI